MSDAKFLIRDAEVGDISAIAEMIGEIERYYGETDIDALDVRTRQTADALFGSSPIANAVVALHDDVLVGFAAFSYIWPGFTATHTLFLKDLFVTEAHRRHGLATQLMEHIGDIARARPDCLRVEWTADRDNPRALAFYEELGHSVNEGKAYYRWPVR